MIVYHYPKCTTCQKALRFLRENDVPFIEKHIVDETPSREELATIIASSGLSVQKFFNTSGIKYRELGLSAKLKELPEEEQVSLLASDGMLIKRPLATDGTQVTVGFKEETYRGTWVER